MTVCIPVIDPVRLATIPVKCSIIRSARTKRPSESDKEEGRATELNGAMDGTVGAAGVADEEEVEGAAGAEVEGAAGAEVEGAEEEAPTACPDIPKAGPPNIPKSPGGKKPASPGGIIIPEKGEGENP